MHFADTHFGVENYGRLDPATGINTRLLDFKQSLCTAIEMAIEHGAQLALFAGDAYKSRDPSQTHQRAFAECIRLLTECGVPVVMLTGNHDIPNVRGRAHAMEIYRTLGVTNVHILSSPELLIVETNGGPVQLAALPYMMKGSMLARDELLGKSVEEVRQEMEKRYAEHVEELAARADRRLPTVLMGHFWVRNARLSGWQQGYFNVNEPQVDKEVLARPEFDYVALGHIHRHQDLNKGAYPPVVYSGSPDCIDFGEKGEDKGFVMVDLVKGSTTFEFVKLPNTRKFIEIDVEADSETPTETILEAINRHNLKNAIVRLTYHISPEHLPLVRDKEIREALAPAFLVVAIRRDVRRDHLTRTKVLTESLDPAAALDHYLDQSEKMQKRKPELVPYADVLFEELRREEALR
jgi:DNA repair protein SbcD/Mre11